MAKHIMLNGEIIPSSEPCLFHSNRGLLYGDSFTFEMRGNSSRVFLVNDYFNYMLSTMSYYSMEKPKLLKKAIFEKDLELLLQKNRVYKGFSAIVTVFRNGTNPKLALDNSVSILISVEALPSEFFILNEKGLKINILKKYKIPEFILDNGFKAIFSREILLKEALELDNLDDALLLDEKGNIIKASDSNVFFVKNGSVIVPSRLSNDYQKIFSDYLEKLIIDLKISIISTEIREMELINFDEVFLVNPIFGIRWVLAYKDKRYFSKMSSLLIKELNNGFRL